MDMQVLRQGEYVGDILCGVQEFGIFASVSGYHQSLFNDAWHCHENAHISFVLKGGCSEKKKDLYERLPGKATFYLSGEPHQIINMYNSTHVNLEMGDGFFNEYDLSGNEFARMINKTPDAILLMLNVYKELVAADQFVPASIRMLLLDFLHRAENWRREEAIPAWMKQVHEMLNDRWSETLTLKELSEAAGVHPITVSHYFPRYFSCTLGAYMRKLKVEKALELLKSGLGLTETAYSCGFFDQSHFIRTFRELTGYLPAQYQKYEAALQ